MKIPANAHPEKACAIKSDGRPKLTEPVFDKDSGAIFASDSYMGVSVPVEHDDDDHTGRIPLDAMKAARSKKSRLSLHADGMASVENYASFNPNPMIDEGSKLPETLNRMIGEAREREHVVEFGIWPHLLVRAAQTFGALQLRVSVGDDPHRPILVQPLPRAGIVEGSVGIVMPIRVAGGTVRPKPTFKASMDALLKEHGWTINGAGRFTKGAKKNLSRAAAIELALGGKA